MFARTSWTVERVQILSTLWLDGRSASEIARALAGGATRNSVIGKVHRLGLGGRERPSRPAERCPGKVRQPPARPKQPAIQLRRVIAAPVSLSLDTGAANILTVAGHACRWPFGDPASNTFTLCGRTAIRGAYCGEHAALAYRPPEDKPRRDRLMRLASLR